MRGDRRDTSVGYKRTKQQANGSSSMAGFILQWVISLYFILSSQVADSRTQIVHDLLLLLLINNCKIEYCKKDIKI